MPSRTEPRWTSALAVLKRLLRHSVAPGLVLLTPFVALIKQYEYGFGRPEILICLGGFGLLSFILGALSSIGGRANVLVLAAVLTVFIDVQFALDFWIYGFGKAKLLATASIVISILIWLLRQHATQLITMVAATVLVSTLILPANAARQWRVSELGPRANLPLIVHLILDEHIGVEGVPGGEPGAVLRSDLRSFYLNTGFHVFGGAFSEHDETYRSMSHLFNFSVNQYAGDLITNDTSEGFR
ncbi:MAG: hypothetical protein ACRD2N_14025, partial [Vicinamibacterales bacterium]